MIRTLQLVILDVFFLRIYNTICIAVSVRKKNFGLIIVFVCHVKVSIFFSSFATSRLFFVFTYSPNRESIFRNLSFVRFRRIIFLSINQYFYFALETKFFNTFAVKFLSFRHFCKAYQNFAPFLIEKFASFCTFIEKMKLLGPLCLCRK